MTKRVLALITALCLVFGMIPAVFAADPDSAVRSADGICGDNLFWSFDSDTGVLTVSGTGPMTDYGELNDVPWREFASAITRIVVEPGATTVGDRAFCGYDSLTAVSLPDSITAIGYAGISECRNLTDISLPEGLVSIGEQAFYANDSLAVLELPSSVRTIGNRAFSNCESLLSMTVPEGVIEIGEHTFSWCESLTEVILPDSITSIANDAFLSCFKLESIDIPDSLTVISDSTFSQCCSLKEVTVPNGVTSIGYSAFYNCTALTSVSLPMTLEAIGDQAFGLCTSLTGFQVDENNPHFTTDDTGALYSKDFTTLYQVPGVTTGFVIPSTVTNVNYGAFWGCYGLTDVEIPDSVTTIGDWAFSDCDALTEAVIPDSVTALGEYAFAFCDQLANVTLSENLTVIPYRAFKECPELTDILIPDSVQIIDGAAFDTCNSLTEITVPAGVTEIDSYAFSDCSGLTEVRFLGDAPTFGQYDVFGSVTATCYYPAGNTTWNDDTMQQFGGTLTWVAEGEAPDPTEPSEPEPSEPEPTEPSAPSEPSEPGDAPDDSGTWGGNLTWELRGTTLYISGEGEMAATVDSDEFPWNKYRETVTCLILEEGITSTAYHSFFWFKALTSVSLPESLQVIGSETFLWCSSLYDITLPEGLITLGERAFEGCESLTEIELPETLTEISWDCFYGTGLIQIDIPDSVTSIATRAFMDCKDLVSVNMPEQLTLIGERAFAGCDSLTSLTLPDSLEVIEIAAFEESGLVSIVLPDSVTDLQHYVFYSCANLEAVLVPDSVVYIGESVFSECPNVTVYCYQLSFAHLYAEAYEVPYQLLEDEPGTPVYNIHVTCGEGGSATVTPNPSPANRYVLLEVQPDKGYVLDTVYYQCLSDPELELVYEQISNTAIAFFMPAGDLELEISFISNKSPFTDVKEGAFYYDAVLWAVRRGITSGVSQTRFAPNDPCTRAQVVTFLWRAAGKPNPTSGKNPFSDVKPSAYYYKAVLWAVENGITTGISATSFGPNSPCTRGQVVTFLYRAAGGGEGYSIQNPFRDVKPTDFYYDAVLWAVENGITTGMSATSFAPGSTCTRGQVVTFLYRFMNS